MGGKTHIVAGAVFAASLWHLGYAALTPSLLIGGALGGLGPDIDHPKSLAAQHMPGGRIAAGTLGRLGMVHRGLTHSLVALAFLWFIGFPWLHYGVYLGLWALTSWLGIQGAYLWLLGILGGGWLKGLAIGWFSHMAVDSFNIDPVQWLWPLGKPFGWLKVPIIAIPVDNNRPWEMVFRLALVALFAWWLARSLGWTMALLYAGAVWIVAEATFNGVRKTPGLP